MALIVGLCGCAGPTSENLQPPASAAAAPQAMVAAAHPLAVDAGLGVLNAGGSAVDAAVAVQAVLGLVEPQSSGLGGGAFLMVYDAESGEVSAYDGRETAPAGATPDMFLNEHGDPLPFEEAAISGRATGAPGAVAMLGLAHAEHGRQPWASLFDAAINLAEDGFGVTPRLADLAASDWPQANTPDAAAYFTNPEGGRVQAGDVLRNSAYADTLRRVASAGPRALLEGPIAREIAAKVSQGPLSGALTEGDLAGYRPLRSDALCRAWREYVVCVPPPPSSGVGLLQLLLLLEHTDIAARGPDDAQAWFLFGEASRLMYADRDRYVGDPVFVSVPVDGLLNPDYVASRAALIGPRAGAPPAPGTPPGAQDAAADQTLERAGTSHFVIVDSEGNAVSMTTTVESAFGSGRMVGGFFLNNQMTDFAFHPLDPVGRPAANAVAPGKRPRSSMSPVIVLDQEGQFVAALGSPGGNAILAYNGKVLVGLFEWGLSMQQAIELPNLVARGASYSVEPEMFAPAVVDGLAARGISLELGPQESGLHGVINRGATLEGGADPRRDGVARGL